MTKGNSKPASKRNALGSRPTGRTLGTLHLICWIISWSCTEQFCFGAQLSFVHVRSSHTTKRSSAANSRIEANILLRAFHAGRGIRVSLIFVLLNCEYCLIQKNEDETYSDATACVESSKQNVSLNPRICGWASFCCMRTPYMDKAQLRAETELFGATPAYDPAD
jgi:hypothetical protein